MIPAAQLQQQYGNEIAAIVLICRVYAGTATQEELAAFLATNKPDWEQLYRMLYLHQLRPVAFKVLYKADIPQDIKDKLQADCTRIAMHNLEHARELGRIYTQLNDAGVTAIPYKGCTFALNYYKDVGGREFSDIDFLVKADKNDLKTIKAAFEQSGYIDKSAVPDAYADTQLKYAREYYFDKYKGEARQFHAEFHWVAASQIFDFPRTLPNDILLADTKETDLYGSKIRVLSDTHHFIAMTIHHGLNQLWALMKYVMDLAMILKNGHGVNEQEIMKLSKEYGFHKAVNLGLYIADEVLGVKTMSYTRPADADEYLDELLGSLNKSRKSTRNVLWLNLKIKDSAADKLTMLWKYVHYSTVPSILDYKFLPLPRALFFLYAIVKPIRMLVSKKETEL